MTNNRKEYLIIISFLIVAILVVLLNWYGDGSPISNSYNSYRSKLPYVTRPKTGSTPNCFEFKELSNLNIDNELSIRVGIGTDVIVKLINKKSDSCIRYVYVRGGDEYHLRNIPEAKYYLKIAYGEEWTEESENNKCYGRFIKKASYEVTKEILNFNRVKKGFPHNLGNEQEVWDFPSYSLKLNFGAILDDQRFSSEKIKVDDFNR
jgi:hypothetical protein